MSDSHFKTKREAESEKGEEMKIPKHIMVAYNVAKTGPKFVTIKPKPLIRLIDSLKSDGKPSMKKTRMELYRIESKLKRVEKMIADAIAKSEFARKG
jgi:hypothetical protein